MSVPPCLGLLALLAACSANGDTGHDAGAAMGSENADTVDTMTDMAQSGDLAGAGPAVEDDMADMNDVAGMMDAQFVRDYLADRFPGTARDAMGAAFDDMVLPLARLGEGTDERYEPAPVDLPASVAMVSYAARPVTSRFAYPNTLTWHAVTADGMAQLMETGLARLDADAPALVIDRTETGAPLSFVADSFAETGPACPTVMGAYAARVSAGSGVDSGTIEFDICTTQMDVEGRSETLPAMFIIVTGAQLQQDTIQEDME